ISTIIIENRVVCYPGRYPTVILRVAGSDLSPGAPEEIRTPDPQIRSLKTRWFRRPPRGWLPPLCRAVFPNTLASAVKQFALTGKPARKVLGLTLVIANRLAIFQHPPCPWPCSRRAAGPGWGPIGDHGVCAWSARSLLSEARRAAAIAQRLDVQVEL